jgi:hypothetical protein
MSTVVVVIWRPEVPSRSIKPPMVVQAGLSITEIAKV